MKGLPEAEVLFIYFGKQVMTKAEEVIKVIKNQVNALWIPNHKLPSGNSPSGQLTALRERFWEVEALKRGREAQASFLHRSKDLPGTAEEKLRSRAEKMRTNMDPSWYPEWWLTFILCGKAAGNMLWLQFLLLFEYGLHRCNGTFDIKWRHWN